MDAIVIRAAKPSDFAFLTQKLAESGGEMIDLNATPCWVTEMDGHITGMACARPVFQLEPILVFSGNKITDSRSMMGLYKAAERWIGDRNNGSGVHWFFMITRSDAVARWAKKFGLFEQWIGARTFIKHL